MAINNRDSDTYHLPRLTALARIGSTLLPHMFLRASSCYNGFSVLLPGFAAQPRKCSGAALSTHPPTLYTCFTLPWCSLQERKLNAFSHESDSCYMHLAHGTWCKNLGPFIQGSDLGCIYKSVSYFLSLLSSCLPGKQE